MAAIDDSPRWCSRVRDLGAGRGHCTLRLRDSARGQRMAQVPYSIDALPREDGEEWRELPGYGGAYAVSSHGRVARLAPSTRTVPGQILAGSLHRCGHRVVRLTGPRATVQVHQLVWRTFRGDVPAGHRITYENGDPLDDRLDNLVPMTHTEQMARVYREGKRQPWPAGNPRARLTPRSSSGCWRPKVRSRLGR